MVFTVVIQQHKKPAVAIETRVKGSNITDNHLSVGFEPEAVISCIL